MARGEERKILFRSFRTCTRTDEYDVDFHNRLIEKAFSRSVGVVFKRQYPVLWTVNEFVNRPNRLGGDGRQQMFVYMLYGSS